MTIDITKLNECPEIYTIEELKLRLSAYLKFRGIKTVDAWGQIYLKDVDIFSNDRLGGYIISYYKIPVLIYFAHSDTFINHKPEYNLS